MYIIGLLIMNSLYFKNCKLHSCNILICSLATFSTGHCIQCLVHVYNYLRDINNSGILYTLPGQRIKWTFFHLDGNIYLFYAQYRTTTIKRCITIYTCSMSFFFLSHIFFFFFMLSTPKFKIFVVVFANTPVTAVVNGAGFYGFGGLKIQELTVRF